MLTHTQAYSRSFSNTLTLTLSRSQCCSYYALVFLYLFCQYLCHNIVVGFINSQCCGFCTIICNLVPLKRKAGMSDGAGGVARGSKTYLACSRLMLSSVQSRQLVFNQAQLRLNKRIFVLFVSISFFVDFFCWLRRRNDFRNFCFWVANFAKLLETSDEARIAH